jgi:hypothetical protein
MKQEITQYISKFLECQHVKVEHRHLVDLLQPFPIPKRKWEMISMDFIRGLPKKIKEHDAIMVVVDKLRKEAHFIPIKSTIKATDVSNVFIKNIFRLHGLPMTIILDRYAKFTSSFCKRLFVGLGTQLTFNTSYHPQIYGHTERVNTVLENMLRMHVIHQPKQWE